MNRLGSAGACGAAPETSVPLPAGGFDHARSGHQSSYRLSRRQVAALLLSSILTVVPAPPASPAGVAQRTFDSPEAAVTALVAAIKSDNPKALLAILGPEGKSLIDSGDRVADRNARQGFAASYEKAHRLAGGGGKVVLHVGQDDFPFPIPLVPDGTGWRFDTPAGKNEILNRRIGKNELCAIQVCLAYVDAQREYYSANPGMPTESASTPAVRQQPGQARRPLLERRRRARSRARSGPSSPRPCARVTGRAGARPFPITATTTASSPHRGRPRPAALRLHGSRAHDRWLRAGGVPAEWDISGVMTFIVNHEGVVYQKNLGPNTAAIARGMKSFDPDPTWKKA